MGWSVGPDEGKLKHYTKIWIPMSGLDETQLGQALDKLMDAKLGPHRHWQLPEVQNTVGPYFPSAFVSYNARRERLILNCETKLATYTNNQIEILIDVRLDDPDEIANEWKGFLWQEINALQKNRPHWFAAGFGHTGYKADFEYWGQMEQYTLHEALLLSVGVEPKHLTENDMEDAKRVAKRRDLSPQIDFLLRRQELFVRRFPSRGFGPLRVPPKFLVEWSDEVGLDVHPDFYDALCKRVLVTCSPEKSGVLS